MKAHRLFIIVPVLLLAAMVLSALWVPSYSKPTTGEFSRTLSFVEASIGDARLLNPILSADSASSRIVDLVFDSLLTYDRDLELQPELASDYQVYEIVRINLPADMAADEVAQQLRNAVEQGDLPALDPHVVSIDAEPAFRERKRFDAQLLVAAGIAASALESVTELDAEIVYPQRLSIQLDAVVSDAQSHLSTIIGADWLSSQPGDRMVIAKIETLDGATVDGVDVNAAEVTNALAALALPLEHNPVIDFSIRRGVLFHDGHELDAQDVVFTYESIMEPRNLSPRTSDFEPIKSVTATSSHSVRVIYKRLFSPAISAWTMPLLPSHLLDDEQQARERERQGISGDDALTFGMKQMPFNRSPVGTGPYRFKSWSSDEQIELAANAEYWSDAPMFNRYSYRIIPDTFSQELELYSGSVDAYRPEPHQVERFVGNHDFATVVNDALVYAYIGYNMRSALFEDPKVRRALGHAVDVNAIIEFVLHGQGKRTSGPFPPTTKWYNPGAPLLEYDPNKALSLLEEAGWTRNDDGWLEKNGQLFEFNLISNQGNLVRRAVMTIAQDAWRKIGVKCNTQVFEWAVFLKDFVNPGEFDAVVLGWSLSPDPDQYQLWHSSQTDPSELNFVGYESDAADALIERIRIEYDDNELKRLVWQLHARIAEDQPYTFLYTSRDTRVLNSALSLQLPGQEPMPVRPNNSGSLYHEFLYWTKSQPVLSM